MLGVPLALALLAQSAASAAATQPVQPPSAPAKAATAGDACSPAQAKPDTRTIVICAQRPNGYRLNPDVGQAKREAHSGGRPPSPYEQPRPDCASVGPFPCVSAGIPLFAAAVTAAEMAKRLAEGKEIGSMFKTDPHPSEYQLYLEAKARREAAEAEKAAAAKAKAEAAAKAKAASGSTAPANSPK